MTYPVGLPPPSRRPSTHDRQPRLHHRLPWLDHGFAPDGQSGAGLTFAGANHSASASLNGDYPTRNGNGS